MAQTELVLLEDIYKLGSTGQIVTVKPGYARNYLIPQGKALRTTKENLAIFEAKKIELAEKAAEKKQDAQKLASKLEGKVFVVIEQASEKGMLYGAVSAASMGRFLIDKGYKISKDAVQIVSPIKNVGIYNVDVVLHAHILTHVTLNIAVSDDQAQIQLEEKNQKSSDKKSLEVQSLDIEPSGDDPSED